MSSAAIFLCWIVGLVLILVVCLVRRPADYFKTKDGRGVLTGILLAVSATALIVWAAPSQAGTWFNAGEVYFGIDSTRKVSPQCEAGGVNDRLTSNLGVRMNLFETADQRATWRVRYTHHSCAINPDRTSYDALGFELTYRIWSR